MKRNLVIMTISTLSVVAGVIALTTMTNADPAAEDAYNADCTPKGYTSEVIVQENYGGSIYKLISASKAEADGWIAHQEVLTVEDPAGCKVLASGTFADALPTESMVDKFTVAFWAHRTNTPQKRKGLESFLASTPIAQADANSMTINSADIKAFKRLGIKYPSYFKGIDTFKSFAEAQEYYDAIFDDEWFKAHPEAGAD